MTDMLAIARTGISAYGKSLDVLADNVANASTPGHVRRVVHLTGATIGGPLTPYDLARRGGNGVAVSAISRATNILQTDTLRRAESQVHGLEAADRWLTEVQSAISGRASLDEPINDFFSALSDFATNPSGLAERTLVIKAAETLADRFNIAVSDVERIADGITKEAGIEVTNLNGLSKELAYINTQLRRAAAAGNNTASLEDERDRVLAEMATIVPIDVQLNDAGQANVRAGDAGGPYLVQGEQVSGARVRPIGDGTLQLRVGPAGDDAPATINTGTIHGLSIARGRTVATVAHLDGLATRIASDVNSVQAGGVDLDGNPGAPLFSLQKPVVEPFAANGGSARVTASMADGATPPDLDLVFDGGVWTLSRTDGTGSPVSGTLPLTLDGVTVEGFGEPRNGDMFRVNLRDGAAGIGVGPLAPSGLAAAPRFLVEPGEVRFDTITVEAKTIASTLSPTPVAPLHFEALGDGTVNLVDDGGTILGNALPGEWINGDGFAVRLTGAPDPGDIFPVDHVRATGADSSANDNAKLLYALSSDPGPDGTIGDAQDRMLTDIAAFLKNIRERGDAATINRDTIAANLQEISGVHLDDEAAEMLRLQQAFQANARILTTAKEIFETILAAAR